MTVESPGQVLSTVIFVCEKDRSNLMNWIVLIIGGASGTGKSELAYRIANKYGISVLEFDDIHTAVKPFA